MKTMTHGILAFPVPPHISQQTIIETISPSKDVDGLNPVNAGRRLGIGCPNTLYAAR